MSPLFHNWLKKLVRPRVLVQLRPDQLLVADRKIACDPRFGAEPWQGALAALKSIEFGKAAVTVVLSNHFVRYALVPWSDSLSTEQEEEAYVRHHFAKIHGERAKGWALRWSDGLCSAIDKALLEELKGLFEKNKKAKLASVQPALMAAFNRARGAIPSAGAWLVMAEADRACVALHAQGRWRSVQNARGEAAALLERERHRASGEAPDFVLQLTA